MKTGTAPLWADYCLQRLTDLCRLRHCTDTLAGEGTKRLLQKAIFSVYLDCVEAGVQWSAREVLAQWTQPSPVRVTVGTKTA